ncbi:MAG: MFS transporter [Flammeovirgaceae bacterium]
MNPKTKNLKPNPYNNIIATIVIAQFACTSIWFAGNAVIADIQQELNLASGLVGQLTSAVQLGFIIGTLVFALFTISDRFSPSKVFFVAATAGALSNLGVYWATSAELLLSLRFITGFCLAGIYPVGMKIAADYREKGLGMALGLLVGALVLGTAFPHLLKAFTGNIPWRYVIIATSFFAFWGGLSVISMVPNGPFRKKSQQVDLKAFMRIFKEKPFRLAAFGYFGHMWELYAFWAFVPSMFVFYQTKNEYELDVSMLAFFAIAIGGLGCAFGGVLSGKLGNAKVALYALIISGLSCILSPLIYSLPFSLFMIFMMIWGLSVVADSPQFSTLVAQTAPATSKGTALTIVNSIGFAITIFSILLINTFIESNPATIYLLLAPGPLFGSISMLRFIKLQRQSS